MSRPILEVSGYTLGYRTRGAARRILDDVSLQIAPGEVLGLVGESGSGKTSFALAVMRALPRNAVESGGPIALAGQNLRAMTPKAATAIRGREIAMVFQDPSTSLNPTLTLGRQVTEVLRRHRALPAEAAHDEAMAILRHVGLRDRAGLMRRYPHQVSGGEKQRVMIATAFATRPDLILFDEPTTALDVITGARVLELFAALRAESGVAALYISHDLALVARVADRVAVLDRSRIVEQAAASAIFTSPQADYTRRLVAAVPRPGRRLPTGTPTSGSILEFDRMTVTYATKRLFRPAPAPNVQGISFTIRPGEILGLVGESGSGKSTVTRAATGLVRFQMRALGLEADLTPVPGDRVNAVGRLKGIDGGASLLFNGHVDTNPVTEGWTVDPWGGLVDDRFIYGIGVSNMKAGDAAYFCAVRTLVEAGVKLKGDVILTFVVGELQGGVGTKALMDQGLRADYFVNAEPTDLEAMTMHAAAFTFIIELIGQTRHLSKREEAVDAIVAACDVIPRLNAMRFTDAPTPEHASINRVHVGVMHSALGRALTEWRPAQVADYVRLQGSGRYATGQTEAHALEDMRRELMPWRPASPA